MYICFLWTKANPHVTSHCKNKMWIHSILHNLIIISSSFLKPLLILPSHETLSLPPKALFLPTLTNGSLYSQLPLSTPLYIFPSYKYTHLRIFFDQLYISLRSVYTYITRQRGEKKRERGHREHVWLGTSFCRGDAFRVANSGAADSNSREKPSSWIWNISDKWCFGYCSYPSLLHSCLYSLDCYPSSHVYCLIE